jgi:hypothetical protein
MQPILEDRKLLAAYLGGWLLLGILVALPMASGEDGFEATVPLVVLPACLVYGLVCLSAWYPARAHPLGATPLGRLLSVHLAGAALSSALWLALVWAWSALLDRAATGLTAKALYPQHRPQLLAAGVLLYLFAVALQYLALAFLASREAERRTLELRLLARQAELDAFKAQIDPHFLFNCLNSISSLCGSDPAAARRTAIGLGELLRATLKLSTRDSISLREELTLARTYLEVERARHGERLTYREDVAAELLDRPIPALLLQPLLENALKHGIAHLVEGGVVTVEGRDAGGSTRLRVSNDCAPDRPTGDGVGIGLANVRGRLRLLYEGAATLEVRDAGPGFEVDLLLPAGTPR